jgi:hypothetical protein
MKTAEWKTYRTRFLVKAKQLTCSLGFTDELGRQHSGRKGDYLVESSDGVIRIVPRQIFEDIYVSMNSDQRQGQGQGQEQRQEQNVSGVEGLGRIRRKQPQPSHTRRTAAQGAGRH